jgi:hypothetical protein
MRLVSPAAALPSFDVVTAAFARPLRILLSRAVSSDAAKKTLVERDEQPLSVVK